jgi:hypothetical protein
MGMWYPSGEGPLPHAPAEDGPPACRGMPYRAAVSRTSSSRARTLDACASASAARRPWRLQAWPGWGAMARVIGVTLAPYCTD